MGQVTAICSFWLQRSSQASTGFSPFELLYGRSVRGPLSVLKESWQAAESQDVSAIHPRHQRKATTDVTIKSDKGSDGPEVLV